MRRFGHVLLSVSACLYILALSATDTWPLPPAERVTAKDLIPLSSWQKQFKITDGKDRGKLVPLTFDYFPGEHQRGKLIVGDYAAIYLRTDPTGALMMERLELFKSRSFVVYEPALPVFAREVASGPSVRRRANFKMYDSASGKLKRAGVASHLVKQVSRSEFITPAGLIDGYNIEIEHRMEMPYAQLDMFLALGCRLDEGPVYGYSQYTLTKLGLLSQTKTAAAGLAIR